MLIVKKITMKKLEMGQILLCYIMVCQSACILQPLYVLK